MYTTVYIPPPPIFSPIKQKRSTVYSLLPNMFLHTAQGRRLARGSSCRLRPSICLCGASAAGRCSRAAPGFLTATTSPTGLFCMCASSRTAAPWASVLAKTSSAAWTLSSATANYRPTSSQQSVWFTLSATFPFEAYRLLLVKARSISAYMLLPNTSHAPCHNVLMYARSSPRNRPPLRLKLLPPAPAPAPTPKPKRQKGEAAQARGNAPPGFVIECLPIAQMPADRVLRMFLLVAYLRNVQVSFIFLHTSRYRIDQSEVFFTVLVFLYKVFFSTQALMHSHLS